MKCDKCGNEYQSQYYFATPTICRECFDKLPDEEKQTHYEMMGQYTQQEKYPARVGFGRRLGAALLDFLIYLFIALVVFVVSGIVDGIMAVAPTSVLDTEAMEEFQAYIYQQVVPLSLLLSVIYYSLEIFLAATPGKLLLGIMIGDEEVQRAPVSKLVARFFVKHIDYVFSLLFILSFIELFNNLSSITFI